MSKRGGLPHTSGEQESVSATAEKTRRPRHKSGSAVALGVHGEVFVRLPDDVAADYLATTERYSARGINPKVVEGAMLRAISAACAGRLETLARTDVMRALEGPKAEGGDAT